MAEFPEIDIVSSSTWRENASLEYLRSIFSRSFAERIGGMTPVLPGAAARAAEISAYCRHWGIRKMIAVDDSSNLLPPGYRSLFLTNGREGLHAAAIEDLRTKLVALRAAQ